MTAKAMIEKPPYFQSGVPYVRRQMVERPNGVYRLRSALGLTTTELARRTGIYANAINRFERTGQGISPAKRLLLAQALGVELWEMYRP